MSDTIRPSPTEPRIIKTSLSKPDAHMHVTADGHYYICSGCEDYKP